MWSRMGSASNIAAHPANPPPRKSVTSATHILAATQSSSRIRTTSTTRIGDAGAGLLPVVAGGGATGAWFMCGLTRIGRSDSEDPIRSYSVFCSFLVSSALCRWRFVSPPTFSLGPLANTQRGIFHLILVRDGHVKIELSVVLSETMRRWQIVVTDLLTTQTVATAVQIESPAVASWVQEKSGAMTCPLFSRCGRPAGSVIVLCG